MKKALICGISGQDGAYLADSLLKQGYQVYGTSRDAQISTFQNLNFLGIRDQIQIESMAITDFRSVLQVINIIDPDEIYNLAGQSSVSLSFTQPVDTFESITIGTVNLLEVIRFLEKPIKLYNACSSECFGDTGGVSANENTTFHPRSPYAVAKSAAYWAVANYREAYSIFACSGILFNHESPFRPERFVTKKIVSAACRIANGSMEKLHLGNISIRRDWGWAPEYVEAMRLMLNADKPDDYVICTGESYSLESFISVAFKRLELNWRDHVIIDRNLFRPTDIQDGKGNPQKAFEILKWKSEYIMSDVVKAMIDHEMKLNLRNF
jgi:GDPmannose 4,6-dehydratase